MFHDFFNIASVPDRMYEWYQWLPFLTGMALWAVAYVLLIINIIKHKFFEIPVFSACAHIAWEILWGLVFPNDMKLWGIYPVTWVYCLGLCLDFFIFYWLLKYGAQQASIPSIPQIQFYFKPLCIIMTLAWLVILYFFYDPYDRMFTPLGANSGFILNLMVSTLYVVLILKQPDADIAKFSTGVAWCKMLGTGLTTAVMFSIYPQNHLVHTLGILVFVLDCTYIYLLRMRKISVVPVPSP